MVHADLRLFLETNLPESKKKKSVLGVSDAKIGAALQEELGLSIQTGGAVAEIVRGEAPHALRRFTGVPMGWAVMMTLLPRHS